MTVWVVQWWKKYFSKLKFWRGSSSDSFSAQWEDHFKPMKACCQDHNSSNVTNGLLLSHSDPTSGLLLPKWPDVTNRINHGAAAGAGLKHCKSMVALGCQRLCDNKGKSWKKTAKVPWQLSWILFWEVEFSASRSCRTPRHIVHHLSKQQEWRGC